MYVWIHNRYSIFWMKMVPGEQRLNRLTSGPLFPGPGSGRGDQCFGPVLPVWELSVGAWGLWSAANISITSRLSTNDYRILVFKLNTLLSFAVKQTSNWLCSYLAFACLCLRHADCLDKSNPEFVRKFRLVLSQLTFEMFLTHSWHVENLFSSISLKSSLLWPLSNLSQFAVQISEALGISQSLFNMSHIFSW